MKTIIFITTILAVLVISGCNDNIDIQDQSINIYGDAQLASIARKIKTGEDLSIEEEIIWQEYQEEEEEEEDE